MNRLQNQRDFEGKRKIRCWAKMNAQLKQRFLPVKLIMATSSNLSTSIRMNNFLLTLLDVIVRIMESFMSLSRRINKRRINNMVLKNLEMIENETIKQIYHVDVVLAAPHRLDVETLVSPFV